MSYQAVIFDLDGTLLDTIEDIAEAINHVLEKRHYPTHTVSQYKMLVGLGMGQLIIDALPETARDVTTVSMVTKEAEQAYSERWQNKSKPYVGVVELLKQLNLRGLKLAVLSNKPHAFTEVCVATLLSDSNFDQVMGAQESIPQKPAPDGAIKIAKALGLAVEQILYVGDSGTDMKTAKAAGIFAVGVSWGFRSEEELKATGADKIIHQPKELIELI
ncbi:HAD family hydrolase [bacterium]|nr:HAD family hydrolase [bacterium]